MEKLLQELTEMKLRENKGKLQQTDARNFKAKLHELMIKVFEPLGFEITEIANAIILEVSNEELGAIPVEAKFVVKALDYDVISAGEEYQQKLADKLAKEKEKAKKA